MFPKFNYVKNLSCEKISNFCLCLLRVSYLGHQARIRLAILGQLLLARGHDLGVILVERLGRLGLDLALRWRGEMRGTGDRG